MSTIKVKRLLENDFNVSNNILEGIAILPSSCDSICIDEIIVVSKSDAIILSLLEDISNKKLSNIGNVFVELTKLLNFCISFNKRVLLTINFIIIF